MSCFLIGCFGDWWVVWLVDVGGFGPSTTGYPKKMVETKMKPRDKLCFSVGVHLLGCWRSSAESFPIGRLIFTNRPKWMRY